MEKVTAAVLITRREATAEASLARRRDRRKLGTAMAAMIKITATTMSSSIRENPLGLRMNSPQAGAFARGRGPREVRLTRVFLGGQIHTPPREFYFKLVCRIQQKVLACRTPLLVMKKVSKRQGEPSGGGECA